MSGSEVDLDRALHVSAYASSCDATAQATNTNAVHSDTYSEEIQHYYLVVFNNRMPNCYMRGLASTATGSSIQQQTGPAITGSS
jgi:hypothetical protein